MTNSGEFPIARVWRLLGGEGEPEPEFSALWNSVVEVVRSKDGTLQEILDKCYRPLQCASANLAVSPETLAASLESLAQIQLTPPSQLQESKGDEAFVGGEYAGRLVLELLQNAHDALAWRHGSHQVIGRFGIGMKGLAGVVRSFTLSSGPWQLRYGAEELSELAGRELSLFRYPLPISKTSRDRPDDLNGVDVSFEIVECEDGNQQLVLRHRGLPFDATDVFSMQLRHRSAKQRVRAACESCPVTEFRFVLGKDESTIRSIREQLEMLGPSDLLFLPHVNTLEVIDGEERRVIETATRREWQYEEIRFSIVEGPGAGLWVKAEDLDGRSIALPVGNRPESQELYSWFRITLVRVPLPLMLHLPALRLSRTREHLDDSGESATENGKELLAACYLISLMVKGIAVRLGMELEAQEQEWLEAAIQDMPGPLFPLDTVLTVPDEGELGGAVRSEEAGTELARWLAHAICAEDVPSVACWIEGRVRLKPPGSVLSIESEPVQEGLELLSSPLPGGSYFPTVETAERLASKVRHDYLSVSIGKFLGLKEPDSEEIETAFRRLFSDCSEERNGLLLVEAPMYDEAARVGLWLKKIDEALLVDVFPVPVEGMTSSAANLLVRMPSDGEDEKIAKAYGELGWASLRAVSYGERLVEVRSELTRRGVVQADPADVLRRLYEGSFSNEQAEAIIRLAWHCYSSMQPQLPDEDYPVLFAAKHLHRMFQNFKHALLSPGSPSSWPVWMTCIHLSGIPLPARDGGLRRAADLSRSAKMEPSLVVDRMRIAEHIGDDEAEQLLGACNVWNGPPVFTLIRRPFQRGDQHFETTFRAWLRTMPQSSHWRRQSFYAVDGDDYNYQARWDINRLHRMPLAWWSTGKKGQPQSIHKEWYRHAGHYEDDQIAWIVDVPPECREANGNAREGIALEYAALLCGQELTGWTFFIDSRPEREGGLQLVNYRATQLGDLPSPLRIRLSQTPFLPTMSSSTETVVKPMEALQWKGRRLSDSPVQTLPVVDTEKLEDSSWLDALMVPDGLHSDPKGQSIDPRWLIGTLFRIGSRTEIDANVVAVYERLVGALAFAAGAESPKGLPGPQGGETWDEYFGRWDFSNPRTKVENWMADAVECGFLGTGMLPGWPADNTEGLLSNLPLLVQQQDGTYEFCKLKDAWKGKAAIYAHTADEQTVVALRKRFTLAKLPTELRVCHLLRIPWYLPDKRDVQFRPARGDSPSRTVLAPVLERLRDPIVHFVSTNSSPKIDTETLYGRWPKGQLDVLEFAPDEVSVHLRGFGKEEAITVSLHEVFFLPAKKAGRTAGDTRLAVAVNSRLSEDGIKDKLRCIAPVVGEVLLSTGQEVRLALETLFQQADRIVNELLSESRLPEGFQAFLAEKGMKEDPRTIQELAQRVVDRLHPLFKALRMETPQVGTLSASDAERARVPELAWRSIARSLDMPTGECPFPQGVLTMEGMHGMTMALKRMEEGLAGTMIAGLLDADLRVPELVDGQEKSMVQERVLFSLGPWWRAAGGRDCPGWEAIPALKVFVGTEREFLVELSRWFVAQDDVAQALRNAFAVGVTEGSTDAVSRVFQEEEIPPPREEEVVRQQWKELFRALVAERETLLALLVLTSRDEESNWEQLRDALESQAHSVRTYLELRAALHRWPEPGPSSFLDMLVPERQTLVAGFGLPCSLELSSLQSWLVETAGQIAPGVWAILTSKPARLTIAGREFVSPSDAQEFFDRNRDSLPLPEWEEHESDGKRVKAKRARKGSTRRGGGGGTFTAKSGAIGTEGEKYVAAMFKSMDGVPYVRQVATRAQAASTWDWLRAGIDESTPVLKRWAAAFTDVPEDAAGRRLFPGFDLLLIQGSESSGYQAVGLEVKATDQEPDTLRFQWTANEFLAARRIEDEESWFWPVDEYWLACVTSLWRPQGEGFAVPRIYVFKNPISQGKKVRVERAVPSPRYHVQIQLPDNSDPAR